jgi:hypothetical protein
MKAICSQCKNLKSVGPIGICHQCKKKNLNKVLDILREERNDAVNILTTIVKNHNKNKSIALEIAKATSLIIQINNNDKYQLSKLETNNLKEFLIE